MTKTPEEKTTVRENRTVQTNLEKPNLTPEEKAREEAETMISEYANNSHISREYYAEGYLSGHHSRDEEVKAYRESLKTIIELAKEVDWDMNTKEKFRSNVRLWQALKDAKDLLK